MFSSPMEVQLIISATLWFMHEVNKLSVLKVTIMVLILDGNSEIGAQVRSNLCYLICLKHLIRNKAVSNRVIFSEKTYVPLCARNMLWVTI